MIYVTHDQVEAMTLATRIVVMRAGQVQQIGTPSEVYERPANMFVAGFLGAPAMNFVKGELDGQGNLAAGPLTLGLRSAHPAQSAVLGVRPEHIRIEANGPLSGVVSLVEPMGSHQVVWISCGEHLLSAIVQDARTFAPGAQLAFSIDAQRVSLFDPHSERAI
jgi:multiple sugar transport system ATP-binding protein